jgi:RND family efflux transporter MFP subunit
MRVLARAIVHAGCTCASLALTVSCSAQKPPPPAPPTVIVSKPLKTKIVDWDEYVGRFDAVNSVDVRPRVTGYLDAIRFRDGELVRKGQVLFEIDPRPYRAALDQARGQESHARSAAENADIELDRARKLLEAHTIAEQEYETRLAVRQQAVADLAAAHAGVETAELNLGFTHVTAPLAGRISDRRVAPGNLVTQDSTVLTNITDLDPIYFTFNGAEAFYLKYEREAQKGTRPLSRGFANPVQIRLQDQPLYAIKGRMDFVDNALDPNSGTIRGRAVVANPNHVLTPGMFGHLRLIGSGAYDGLLIPDQAVTTQQSDEIAYVVAANGEVEQRKLVLGPRIGNLRVVRSGLEDTDTVVIDGIQRAKAGTRVTAKAGKITPPDPDSMPSPVDASPPPASATFPDSTR